MKRNDLIQLLASENATPPAQAADELDRVVSDILKRLRSGNPVQLPGIGLLQPDREAGIQFRSADAKKPPRRKGAR
jgi:nucleoid DNA-binding protein